VREKQCEGEREHIARKERDGKGKSREGEKDRRKIWRERENELVEEKVRKKKMRE
jgi:hypothetical protein